MSHAIAWFKVAADVFANMKVRRAGPFGFLVFAFVLARNAARDALGWIPAVELESWYVADTLRLEESQAASGIASALAANLIAIDGDRVVIVGWEDEWAKRPLTEAERKRLQRSKGKESDVRTDVRTPADDVPFEKDSPECPTGEERREEERKQEEWSGEEPRKRARARGTRTAPSEWSPRPEDALLPPSQLAHELAKFRDHQFKDAKTDWDATWRNWQRRNLDGGTRGGSQGTRSVFDVVDSVDLSHLNSEGSR